MSCCLVSNASPPSYDSVFGGASNTNNEQFIVAVKVAVVFLMFAGLIAGTLLMGSLASTLVATGAMNWQIGAAIGGAAALGIAAIAALPLGQCMRMYEKTGDDGCDMACYVAVMSLGALYLFSRCLWEGLKTGAILDCLQAISK